MRSVFHQGLYFTICIHDAFIHLPTRHLLSNPHSHTSTTKAKHPPLHATRIQKPAPYPPLYHLSHVDIATRRPASVRTRPRPPTIRAPPPRPYHPTSAAPWAQVINNGDDTGYTYRRYWRRVDLTGLQDRLSCGGSVEGLVWGAYVLHGWLGRGGGWEGWVWRFGKMVFRRRVLRNGQGLILLDEALGSYEVRVCSCRGYR